MHFGEYLSIKVYAKACNLVYICHYDNEVESFLDGIIGSPCFRSVSILQNCVPNICINCKISSKTFEHLTCGHLNVFVSPNE